MKHYSLIVLGLAALLTCAVSCKSGSDAGSPDTAFNTYIKAYTGGSVPSSSTVRIEFNAAADRQAEDGVISFSPSIKGTSHWISDTSLEFFPDEGALDPGTVYTASLKLADIFDEVPSDLRKFQFSFRVLPKEVTLVCSPARIESYDAAKASVSGSLCFTEPVEVDAARKMLSCTYPAGDLTIEYSQLSATEVGFTVSGLSRNSNDNELELKVDGSSKGYKHSRTASVTVPSTDGFEVVDAVSEYGADPYVEVFFSQPLDASMDTKGLVELSEVGRFYTEIDGNSLKIWYDSMYSSELELELAAGLKSFDGSKLKNSFKKTFSKEVAVPEISLAFSGSVVPDGASLELPFRSVNLNAVDVSVVKIYENNVLMYLQDNNLGGESNLRRSGRLVYKTTVRLDSDPNKDLSKWQNFSLDLSKLFRKEPGVIYRIRLSFTKDYYIFSDGGASSSLVSMSGDGITEEEKDIWDTPYSYYYENYYDWNEYDWDESEDPTKASFYMDGDRYPYCTLLSSNLGMLASSADNGRMWVAVNDINSAGPVPGAEVTAYNFQLQEVAKAKTDSKGMAEFTYDTKPFALVVRKDKAVGYLKVTDGEEKTLSRFDVGGEHLTSGLKGFVYGERGVWRPGDTLHLSLIIEDREHLIPDHHPVTMELYSPMGQFYTKQINAKGLNGFYVFDVPTQTSDPTGTWNAYFKVGGATFHKSLPIETVKANRLKIDLDVKDRILTSGTAMLFNLTSNWLTGPAASGLASIVEMDLSRRSTSFKGFETYNFNDPVSSFSSSSYVIFEKKLDASGKASANVIMPKAEDAPGLLNARLVSRVNEQGGDASIVTKDMVLSPFKSYVGVKFPETDDSYLETDTDIPIKVVTLDKEGKHVSGDKLEYKIFKLSWSWWWESRAESLDSYVNGRSATPVSEGVLTSSSSASTINFRVDYPDWGRYLVYVKDLTSGHASGGIIYVDWPSWRGRSDKSDPTGLTMLSFTTDKKEYEVGENVTVYIPSAKGGKALVSLENGRGVISRNWVDTSDSEDTKYTFAVTADMAPNFYVHITLLQPHERADNDLPLRMYGVQPVMVTNKDSHLEPVLTVPSVIRPQEKFSVKVKEASGKPMTYTLAIVDEGLLDITSFKTPDPWKTMYAREALGVKTWDIYDDVFGAYSGKFSPLASIGGDIDLSAASRQDNRFNPVVEFIGPFTLQKGENVHDITLPMYVGSVRVMVVAGQDGAYGNAEATAPVRSPLMVLSSLPRALGNGEDVTLPVNVFAMEDNVRNVNVAVEVDGPLKLSGPSSKSLTFSAAGDELARFSLRSADYEEGVAHVKINASSGSNKASETIAIEVRNPSAPVRNVSSLTVAGGKTGEISFAPFSAGDGTNEAVLTLMNFPSIDFEEIVTFADAYDYNCTEQLSSRLLTYLYAKPFVDEKRAASIDANVQKILQELYSRQLPDGGFATYPGITSPNDWVSSEAGHALVEAAVRGYSVNKSVITSWKKYQKKAASAYKYTANYKSTDLLQAYRLYTMAVAGTADEAAMNRLKSAPEITLQARWRLAAAYAVAGKKAVAQQLLTEVPDAESGESEAGTYSYGSSKDLPMYLETAVLTGDMPLAMELAGKVSAYFHKYGYMTQTAAFASIAMGRLADKVGDEPVDVVVTDLSDHNVKSAKSVYSLSVDPGDGKISIRNNGGKDVYASLLMTRKLPADQKVDAASSAVALSVKYTDLSGKEIDPTKLSQGTDFYANLIVSNISALADNMKDLVLDLPVPSGWEIFNERLFLDGDQSEAIYDYQDIRDDRAVWYFDLPAAKRKVFKLRLQAAYEGQYALPSASCECMYVPSVYARTASGTVEVTR